MAEGKLRIHNLSKELEVSNQAIIEKCRAEGIDVKNHMHVVGAGLAATIREWFSEGAHTTTLEESNRVNLDAVRVKPKRASKQADDAESGGVAVIEAPATEPAPPAKKTPAKKAAPAPLVAEPPPREAVEETTEAPTIAPAPATIAAEAPPAAAKVAAESPQAAPPPAPAPVAKAPAHAPSAAASKLPVAGPQNVPMPAKLSGPRVVRMDKAEVVDVPRGPRTGPRGPRPPGMPPPIGRGLPPTDDEREALRGRGFRAKPGEREPGEAAAEKKVPVKRPLKDEREEALERLKEWRDRDLIERRERLEHASGRGIGGLRAIEGKQPTRRGAGQRAAPAARKDKIELTEPITIKAFSRETGLTVSDIVKKLMSEHGQMAGMNSVLDIELATSMAAEHGIQLTVVKAKTGLEKLADAYAELPRKRLLPRPPVVTVLGHVDHGKTTLLDRIRSANVAAGEAGGITQHIGAYRVRVGDRWVTFLDTPGHTAFTAMRARGAKMTDVVVLVVAADDGVMPTTVEAINHARAAGTPIVVALNKIDLPHDINKIYGQLTEHGLTPSGDWGGDTDVIKVAALRGQGVDELLAHLATLSEVMDLKADATLAASGTVIEAQRSDSLGNVARVLVQEGTLRTGDVIVCGASYGKVRALRDDRGQVVKEAGPATPVEVSGLSDVPRAGDRFFAIDSVQEAKAIAEEAAMHLREQELIRTRKPTNLESMLATAAEGEIPELQVIVRADVQGSVDVLKKTLSEFPSDQVRLNIIHSGVGTVTESDLVLAQASEAIVIAFHVAPESAISKRAENLGVDVRSYMVIYEMLDDIRKALEGLLTPDEKIESRGRAEVRAVFNISKIGKVAGCFVRDGVIQRSNSVKVLRDGVIVKDKAAIESLRRVKDDAKEVRSGLECGIRITNFDDLKPGDIIEAFEVVKIARTLDGKAAG